MANKFEELGIVEVGQVTGQNLYSTPYDPKQDYSESMKRQQAALELAQSILPDGPTGFGDIGLSASMEEIPGMTATQQALEDIFSSNNKEIIMWDTETLGTSKRSRFGKSSSIDFFDVTQISLQKFKYNGEALEKAVEDPTVLAVGLTDGTAKKMREMVAQLKRNPETLFNFNDDERRSLADLTLFSDRSHFGKKEINGHLFSVMTQQNEQKPSYKGTALTEAENILRMEMGLKNLTDGRLVNNQEQALKAMNYYVSNNSIFAGHNVNRFDTPNFLEWMKNAKTPEAKRVRKQLGNPSVDTYPLSQMLFNKGQKETSTNQLGDLFQFIAGPSAVAGPAHFAGNDTDMNARVLDELLKRSKKNSTVMSGTRRVLPGQEFISERGTGGFFASTFNNMEGQYDTTMRWAADKKQWVQNYEFQENPIVAGHKYKFHGSYDDLEFNGVKHFGMVLEDMDTGVYKFIPRENKNNLMDLFNHLTPADQVSEERIQYIKKDTQRRHYESLFDPKAKGTNDTVAKRLNQAYDILDRYDAEISKLVSGDEKIDAKTSYQAMHNVQEQLNKGKPSDSLYLNSFEKIEKTVGLRDTLRMEEPMWKKMIGVASTMTTPEGGNQKDAQFQNLFMNNVYKQYRSAAGNPKEAYGYSTMRMLPYIDAKNKERFLTATTDAKLEEGLRRMLTINDNNDARTSLENFGQFLRQQKGISEKDRKILYDNIRKELRENKKISPGQLTNLTSMVKTSAENNGQFVSEVMGTQITPSATLKEFVNQSDDYGRLIKQEIARSKTQLSSSTSRANFSKFNLDGISSEVATRIQKAQQVSAYFDTQAGMTQGIYGMNGNSGKGIRKKGIDYQAQIQRTIESFEENGFIVNLDYMKESDELALFFTESKNAPLMNAMSIKEKRFHDKINRVSIPLFDDNGTININGTRLTNQFKAEIKNGDPNSIFFSNSADRSFQQLQYLPKNIKDKFALYEAEGRNFKRNDVIEQAIGGYRNRITQGQVASAFPGDTSPDKAMAVASRGKNLSAGFSMDISSYGDILLKQYDENAYDEFLNWQRENNMQHTNFIQSGWSPKNNRFDLRNKVLLHLPNEWNKAYGKNTRYGMEVTVQGVNNQQFASGRVFVKDPRNFTPLGTYNPSAREQILKTQNYHPMRRDELATYLENQGLTGSDIDRRFAGGTSRAGALFDAFTKGESGVEGIGIRTAYLDDSEMKNVIDQTVKNIDKDILNLESKLTLSVGDAKKAIESDLKELRLMKNQATSGTLSNYDGQALLREELLSSIKTVDEARIQLKTGYKVEGQLQEHIQKQLGDQAFENGVLRFDQAIGFETMKNMKLIDDNGMLTVGTLVRDGMIEEGEQLSEDVLRRQKYRVFEESRIVGIERGRKGDRLLLEQVQSGKNGTKILDAYLGTRNTGVGVMGGLMDRFSDVIGHRVDSIQEQINIGRNPYGGMLTTMIETNFENVQEQISRVISSGDMSQAQLPALRKALKGRNLTAADLKNPATRQSLLQQVMNPNLSTMGLAEAVSVDETGTRLIYDTIQDDSKMVGEVGHSNYQKFYDDSVANFGFDSKNAYTRMKAHNVVDYQGASTKARYSLREMNLLEEKLREGGSVGSDNIIYRQMNKLLDNESRALHQSYGEQVRFARDVLSGPEDVTKILQKGNVVFDMTGSIAAADGSNVYLGKNGELVFDATSLGQMPSSANRTNFNAANTLADPGSILLNNPDLEIYNETFADYQKRTGANGFVKLSSETQRDANGFQVFSRNYIPVVQNINADLPDFEGSHARELQKNFENIINGTYFYGQQQYTVQDGVRDELSQQATERSVSYRKRVNQAIEDYGMNANRHMTNTAKSGFMKGTKTITSQNGFSAKSGTYSFFDTYQDTGAGNFQLTGKRQVDEFFVSRDAALASIKGIERDILDANNINYDGWDSDKMQAEVLDRMTGTRKGGSEFEVVSLINRQPSQSQGSLNFLSMRIDEQLTQSKDGRILISPQAAKNMGADYDGDTIYAMLDHYRGTSSTNEAREMQQALVRQRRRFEEEAKAQGFVPKAGDGDSFAALRNLDPNNESDMVTVQNLMRNQADSLADAQYAASRFQAGNIGVVDNTMVANRDLLQYVYGEAFQRGQIKESAYFDAVSSWDKMGDAFVQNFISAKKITYDNMGIDKDTFDSLSGSEQLNYVFQNTEEFVNRQSNIPGMLKNVRHENIPDILDKFRAIKAMGEDQEELFNTALTHIANAQGATQSWNGVYNPAFDIKSSGNTTGRIMDQLSSDASQLLPTRNMVHFAEQALASDDVALGDFRTRTEEVGNAVANNLSNILKGNSPGVDFSETAEQQMNLMSGMFSQNRTQRKGIESSMVIDALKSKGSQLASSPAAKAGAGFAAMWMLGSAIKGGPTPEGNEAQQEATPVEVNPAALLTSPTARVTTNAGQNVRLQVSGSGNVDQQEIAGLVNQQVSSMTGVPMNMNVNVSDNTQTLDKSFYENALNRILGL